MCRVLVSSIRLPNGVVSSAVVLEMFPEVLWTTWRKYVKVHHSLDMHFLPKHHLTAHLLQRMMHKNVGMGSPETVFNGL